MQSRGSKWTVLRDVASRGNRTVWVSLVPDQGKGVVTVLKEWNPIDEGCGSNSINFHPSTYVWEQTKHQQLAYGNPVRSPLTNSFPNPNRAQWHGLLQIIENIPPVHLDDKLLHACLFNFNNLPALDFDSVFSILKESSVSKLIMHLKMYCLPRSLWQYQ